MPEYNHEKYSNSSLRNHPHLTPIWSTLITFKSKDSELLGHARQSVENHVLGAYK